MSLHQAKFNVHDDFLHFVLKLQSVFRILVDDQVREDFKTRKIISVDSPETILSSIDVMSRILFPNWNMMKFNDIATFEISKTHLYLLWERSHDDFELYSDAMELELFTYNAWFEAFEGLFTSIYWKSLENTDDVSILKYVRNI